MNLNRKNRLNKTALALLIVWTTGGLSAEPLPARLRGIWRIARILPTHNIACWGQDQAIKLVGTTLTYGDRSMRWQGGPVPLQGIVTREVTAEEFASENSGGGSSLDFNMIGIRAASVTEVDLQHEDADITGATTEVPGDAVLMAAPNRTVVSACGVYYEATRIAAPANKKRR
jgi:hypothetical protein